MAKRNGRNSTLKRLPRNYLFCRTVGHQWSQLDRDQYEMPKVGWGTPFGLQCSGCQMVRIDVIDSMGNLSYRMYRQPLNYKISKGDTPKRNAFRLELLKR